MHNYTAYGLRIRSDLRLPELQPSLETDADVTIQIGKLDWSPPEHNPSWRYFDIRHETAYFYWDIVGKFLIRAGREIVIEPVIDVDEQVIRLPLLGSVLAMILHQRHYLVLHASAVAIDQHAAIFLGPKGQGKSTMAAALCKRGHPLMADDVAALAISDAGAITVLPGFPQIKLWPEAVKAALDDNPEGLSRVHPEVEKRARPALASFWQEPLELRRIYLLSEGPVLQVTALGLQEGVSKLLGNSYIPYLLGQQFLQSPETALHMQQCAKLASAIPVCQLARPYDLARLSEVAERVETDMAAAYPMTLA